MTKRGWLWFVALGIIWGLPYFLIKIAVREISPPLLVFIRTGGGAVVLVPLAAARGALRPALRRWRAILCYACAEMAVPWLLLFNAERRLPSSFTGLMVAAVPLAAAGLAALTGTDRLDLRRMGGIGLGLAGVGALVGFNVNGSQALSVLALLVVACGYALGPWIVAHRLADVPPIGVMAWSFLLCALAYSPAAVIDLPTRSLAPTVAGSAAALTVVCTIVAFLCFFALIKEVGAMRTTLITYVNPAVAVVVGVAVLGERFTAATAVGFVLILGGCLLATRAVATADGAGGDRSSDAEAVSAAAEAPGGIPEAGIDAVPAAPVRADPVRRARGGPPEAPP